MIDKDKILRMAAELSAAMTTDPATGSVAIGRKAKRKVLVDNLPTGITYRQYLKVGRHTRKTVTAVEQQLIKSV